MTGRSILQIRAADPSDWDLVEPFFTRNYRTNHPFQSQSFWNWQTESPSHSGALIAVDSDEVVGHRAYNVGGGFTWGMMTFIEPKYRGGGLIWEILGGLKELTSDFGPPAATNSNQRMVRLYRRLKWHRHADLIRRVALRPDTSAGKLIRPIQLRTHFESPVGHYWRQPGINGIRLQYGAGAAQVAVGGLRLVNVDADDPASLLEEAWDAGFLWVDYLTSWNDPVLDELSDDLWMEDEDSPVPWLLDPVEDGSTAVIRVFSSEPMPPDLVVRRTYSDHGRVGSLPAGSEPGP